jgi:hypothetical protein
MSESKKVVSLRDRTRTLQRSGDQPSDPGPSPEEGLRLVEAFRGIKDPNARRSLLETAYRLRAGTPDKDA